MIQTLPNNWKKSIKDHVPSGSHVEERLNTNFPDLSFLFKIEAIETPGS